MAEEEEEEKKKKKKKSYIPLLITILIIILMQGIKQIGFIEGIEKASYDARLSQLRGPLPALEDVVIIEIGDQSYEAMNERFPWPRNYHGHVVENLAEAGAKLIVFDIQFDVSGKTTEEDSLFAEAIKNAGNVVLVSTTATSGARSASTGSDDDSLALSLIKSIDMLDSVSLGHGLVGVSGDIDGIYRQYTIGQPVNSVDGIYYEPSLALKVFKLMRDDIPKDAKLIKLENDDWQLGNVIIPSFKHGKSATNNGFLINYIGGRNQFKYYSYETIIDDVDFDISDDYDIDAFDDPGDPELGIPAGLLESGVLKDKIVFIGVTLAEAHDIFPTPFASDPNDVVQQTPGVEIHANALQTLLTQTYFEYPDPIINFLIIFVLAFLVYTFIMRFSTGKVLLLSFLLFVIYMTVNIMLFSSYTVLEFINPIMTIFLVFTSNYVYQYLSTQKEKAMIKGAFAHYVPAKVVDSLIDNPDMLQLGGEEREMSVMFSDVAGFTTISEKLTPKQLVNLLNEYLTAMTDLVLLNDGIIDKYEGDAIMAEWGAPIPSFDHAFKACHTAILMQRKLTQLRENLVKRGLPPLRARIGINTGQMVVGNMGSREVFDYTVMGDAVNLASRLEGGNKPYNTVMMISETTYDAVKDKIRCRELDLLTVKGKTEPIRVFEIINHLRDEISDDELKLYELFGQGLQLYREQKFNDAITVFNQALAIKADDGPSVLFKERSQDFLVNPPPTDWDGVFTMTTK